MAKLFKSEILSPEKECEALVNRNSEYRLSGDCEEFFLCAITGRACIGRIIRDDDDQSSQFFSRGHATIDKEALKNCASCGITKEELPGVIRKRKENEANDLINNL
jgi:hypothetical protein